MYGEDRLTRPLLRMKNGRYDKDGRVHAGDAGTRRSTSWREKWKAALKKKGPSSVGMFMSGQSTIWEGYAVGQADEGRLSLQQHRSQRAPLHGERRGRLHAHLRHRRADGLLRRHRARRCLRAVGLEHGGDAPDPVGSGSRTGASAHPHVQVAVLSTFEHRSYDLADLPLTFRPQTDLAILNYIANYIIQNNAREPRLRRPSTSRSAWATTTSATACGPSTRCRRRRRTPRMPAASSRSASTSSRSSSRSTT